MAIFDRWRRGSKAGSKPLDGVMTQINAEVSREFPVIAPLHIEPVGPMDDVRRQRIELLANELAQAAPHLSLDVDGHHFERVMVAPSDDVVSDLQRQPWFGYRVITLAVDGFPLDRSVVWRDGKPFLSGTESSSRKFDKNASIFERAFPYLIDHATANARAAAASVDPSPAYAVAKAMNFDVDSHLTDEGFRCRRGIVRFSVEKVIKDRDQRLGDSRRHSPDGVRRDIDELYRATVRSFAELLPVLGFGETETGRTAARLHRAMGLFDEFDKRLSVVRRTGQERLSDQTRSVMQAVLEIPNRVDANFLEEVKVENNSTSLGPREDFRQLCRWQSPDSKPDWKSKELREAWYEWPQRDDWVAACEKLLDDLTVEYGLDGPKSLDELSGHLDDGAIYRPQQQIAQIAVLQDAVTRAEEVIDEVTWQVLERIDSAIGDDDVAATVGSRSYVWRGDLKVDGASVRHRSAQQNVEFLRDVPELMYQFEMELRSGEIEAAGVAGRFDAMDEFGRADLGISANQLSKQNGRRDFGDIGF